MYVCACCTCHIMISEISMSISVNICFFLFVCPQFILCYFFAVRPVVICSIISPTSWLTFSHINLILLSEYLVLHSFSHLDSLFDSLHYICIDLNLGLNGYTSVCATSVLCNECYTKFINSCSISTFAYKLPHNLIYLLLVRDVSC
jgi:hypothetical protein